MNIRGNQALARFVRSTENVLKTRPVLEIKDLKDPEGAGRVLRTVSATLKLLNPVFIETKLH